MVPITYEGRCTYAHIQLFVNAIDAQAKRKNGSIAGTVIVFRDISERKEAEQALRESRATARGLLDATQESLLLLDKEGIIIAANQTAARRHQQTPEELIGKNRFDILPENLRESRKAHFNNVLQTGIPEAFEDTREYDVLQQLLSISGSRR